MLIIVIIIHDIISIAFISWFHLSFNKFYHVSLGLWGRIANLWKTKYWLTHSSIIWTMPNWEGLIFALFCNGRNWINLELIIYWNCSCTSIEHHVPKIEIILILRYILIIAGVVATHLNWGSITLGTLIMLGISIWWIIHIDLLILSSILIDSYVAAFVILVLLLLLLLLLLLFVQGSVNIGVGRSIVKSEWRVI
jgi:hypothetical protein